MSHLPWWKNQGYILGQEQKKQLLQEMGHYPEIPQLSSDFHQEISEVQIRERAYSIWQKTGNSDANANWFKAIQELRDEQTKRQIDFEEVD